MEYLGIEHLEGNRHIQGSGKVNKNPFEFRCEGKEWKFSITQTNKTDSNGDDFYRTGDIDGNELSPSGIREIIVGCTVEYFLGKLKTKIMAREAIPIDQRQLLITWPKKEKTDNNKAIITMNLAIDYFHSLLGCIPFQSHGTVNGSPFDFCFRWQEWHFGIPEYRYYPADDDRSFQRFDYFDDDDDFSNDDAVNVIIRCAAEYIAAENNQKIA